MTATEFFVLLFPTLLISNGDSSKTRNAVEVTTQALYHSDKKLKALAKNIEQKYIPEYIKRNAWLYSISYSAIKDQQISYTWTF